MKRFSYFILGLCICFGACESLEPESATLTEFRKEIQLLKTESEKDTFLANLFVQDQAIRTDGKEQEIISKFGYRSNEHKEHLKLFVKENLEIFNQLRLYLEIHGYTKETSFFSDKAKWAITYVTGHRADYDDQLHILKLLIPAFKNGLIPLEEIVWILSEMHEVNYSELLKVQKERYTLEDEFDGLVTKLGLKELFQE